MLGSQSGFDAKIKHWIIHCNVLASRTLPAIMKNKNIYVVNFVKTSEAKLRLYTALGKDINTNRETLLFHAAI